MNETDIRFMKEHITEIKSRCNLLEIMVNNLNKELLQSEQKGDKKECKN